MSTAAQKQLALYRCTEQPEVSKGIEQLVTNRLIDKAQSLWIEQSILVEDHSARQARSERKARAVQLIGFTRKAEGARRGDLVYESLLVIVEAQPLRANQAVWEVDFATNREVLCWPKHTTAVALLNGQLSCHAPAGDGGALYWLAGRKQRADEWGSAAIESRQLAARHLDDAFEDPQPDKCGENVLYGSDARPIIADQHGMSFGVENIERRDGKLAILGLEEKPSEVWRNSRRGPSATVKPDTFYPAG